MFFKVGRHHRPLRFFKVERKSYALPSSFLLEVKPQRESHKQSWQGESLPLLPSIQSSLLFTLISKIPQENHIFAPGQNAHHYKRGTVRLKGHQCQCLIVKDFFRSLPYISKGRGKTDVREGDPRSVEPQWTNLTHDLGSWICLL